MNNKLLNIYGARISKNGKYINLSFVRGENETKEFFNCPVMINKEGGKIIADRCKQQINNKDYIFICVPLLQDDKKKEEKEIITDDMIPF